jgi:hypothetical protein
MSGSSWNFDGEPRSDGNGLGNLLAIGVLRGGEDGMAFDGDDEGGEVAVADDPPGLLLDGPKGGLLIALVEKSRTTASGFSA